MATYVNYTSLFADIQNYLERGGSSVTDQTVYNQIPRLINSAERKIVQVLKLLGELTVLVDPDGLQNGVSVLTKPDRWRSTVSMNYGAGADSNVRTPLYPRSLEYCRRYWPDDSVTTATPVYYADYDLQHWLVAGTPNATFPLEVNCYMQPVLLDDANQNNFFTEYVPNLLLYGTLVEASGFLKNDPRIATWKQLWTDELNSLSSQDMQRILDRAAERKTV